MKFGRLQRARLPAVPHLSALLSGQRAALAPPPPSVDYLKALPSDLGMMLNDKLGDCTCAGVYHALQVWSCNGFGVIDTESDANVQQLYHEACGYDPGDSSTDNGGVEQFVLTYLLNTGAPIGSAGGRHKISSFVEVDVDRVDDVKLTINDCGVAYIGFDVPSWLDPSDSSLWTDKGRARSIGGHCVVLAAYDDEGPTCITWGRRQKMTWEFFQAQTDEVYAIIDPSWFSETGKSPLGMSLDELQAQVVLLKNE